MVSRSVCLHCLLCSCIVVAAVGLGTFQVSLHCWLCSCIVVAVVVVVSVCLHCLLCIGSCGRGCVCSASICDMCSSLSLVDRLLSLRFQTAFTDCFAVAIMGCGCVCSATIHGICSLQFTFTCNSSAFCMVTHSCSLFLYRRVLRSLAPSWTP